MTFFLMKRTMEDNQSAARLDERIEQLNASDRYIDLDLLAEIMAQGEAAVDRLIEVLENDDGWPQVHALLMLIEMRAEKALPIIARTLLQDHELNEWLDKEGLDKFGPVAIDTLESMVRDNSADWYPRAIAANALVRIAARHPDTYPRITAILRDLLPGPDMEPYKDGDPDVWSSVAGDLITLRDPEAYDRIGQLFDADWYDPTWLSRRFYEEGYRQTGPFLGVALEPRDLLDSHRAMQEHWRRSEAKKPSPVSPALERPASPLGRPSTAKPKSAKSRRKQRRKAQKSARRQQRRKKKRRR